MQSIAAGLLANHGIIDLNIGWNEFGVDGAKALGAALKDNDTLLYLDLRKF